MPVYIYPANIISSALLGKYLLGDITSRIRRNEMQWHGTLDAQRQHGKAIFGGGFLVSDRAAKMMQEVEEEAKKVKEEVKKAEEEAKKAEEEAKKAKASIFPLSEREKEIIAGLG